ncbi:MAG: acyl carrier protein [Nitrospinaceae bacterium]
MTREQVRQAILNIISDIAPDEDLGAVKDEEKLRDQFDLDSMDFLDIVMELRKRFNLEVPEKDYQELVTVASCVEYLFPRLKDYELVS